MLDEILVSQLREEQDQDSFELLEEFHEASKIHPAYSAWGLSGASFANTDARAVELLRWNVRRRTGAATLGLTAPVRLDASLSDVLRDRRSLRDFCQRKPILASDVSTLLHHGYGVIDQSGAKVARRSVPSGGALYPLELYVLAVNVDSIDSGTYHYLPDTHRLERISGSLNAEIVSHLLIESSLGAQVGNASIHIAITAVFPRVTFKYGLRAYRLSVLEAGHVAHSILMAATASQLAAVPHCFFYENAIDDHLGVDGVTEATLYMVSVGHLRD